MQGIYSLNYKILADDSFILKNVQEDVSTYVSRCGDNRLCGYLNLYDSEGCMVALK